MQELTRKRRTRLEVIYNILSVCENCARKTWIMYRANLSYELANNYINELISKNLIEQRDNLFCLTDKGKQLLELLKQYIEKKNDAKNLLQQITSFL